MPNFLLAYHGGSMPETPEAQQAVMTAWEQWFGTLGSAVVDGGNPVSGITTIAPGGTVSAGGGANPVSGYSVLMADNMDAAVKMAQGCPVLQGGGSIEVCETFNAM